MRTQLFVNNFFMPFCKISKVQKGALRMVRLLTLTMILLGLLAPTVHHLSLRMHLDPEPGPNTKTYAHLLDLATMFTTIVPPMIHGAMQHLALEKTVAELKLVVVQMEKAGSSLLAKTGPFRQYEDVASALPAFMEAISEHAGVAAMH